MLLSWLSVLPEVVGVPLVVVGAPIEGPLPGEPAAIGLVCVGLLGVAVEGTPGCPISRLTKKVRQARDGDESVDFTTDREDEIGELYDAVGNLVESRREQEQRLQKSERYRRRLYEIAADSSLDADEKIEQLLELGRKRLGVGNAIVTHIDTEAGRYEIQRVSGSDFVEEGTVLDLSETFCRRTVDSDDALGIYDAIEEGDEGDPACEEWNVHCYIGSKILVDDELYGTVCFLDDEPREEPFSHTEKVFVDLVGRWISHVYERFERQTVLERYEDLIESVPVATFLTTVEGEILDVNEAFTRQFGADSPEAFRGRGARDLWVDPDDREVLVAKVKREGTVQGELSRMHTLDGEERWIEVTMIVTDGPDGQCLTGICHDVTEREEREQELQRMQTQMELALEMTDAAVWEMNSDGSEMTYYPSSDPVHDREVETLYDALAQIHPDDRRQVAEAIESGYETGQSTAEYRTGRDGESRWIEVRSHVESAPDGTPARAVGVSRDITDRKEREQRLTRLNQEYETVLDNTQEAIFLVDVDDDEFRIARINRAEEEILGLSAEEAKGTTVDDLFDDDIASEVRARYQECLEAKGPIEYEETYDLPDGRSTFYTKLSPVNEDGEITQIVGVTRDITERKRRERELQEREQQLQRTKEMLQQSQRLARVGAWEFDVTGDEPSLLQTDEVYRIYGLSPDTDMAYEEAIEVIHPDDRQHVRDHVERAIELGESYDIEFRVVTATGDTRWLRAIGDPVTEDGDVVAVRGSIQDVTDQKQREFALESLQEATQELLTTERIDGAATLVVEAGASILDVDAVGIYQYDDTGNVLEPSALSDGFEKYCEGTAGSIGPGTESFLWHSYVTGTLSVINQSATVPEADPLVGSVGSGIVVPIGSYGVFVAVDESDSLDESTRRLVETLVATTEAAFDRIESEAALREREAEIESQNDRLKRQIRINETIRSVSQSLIGASSQSELESEVCEGLVACEDISFAWIGEFDSAGQTLSVRGWAGSEQGYFDNVSLDRTDAALEPAVETAVSGEPTVVGNVAQNVQREAWRQSALASNFQSVLAVPIELDEYSYGVLVVYTPVVGMFSDLEENVFAELGESIANAINSVTTRQALHSDTLVSLTLRIEDTNDQFTALAAAADCTVHYEGLATQSAEETRLFVRTTGADPETVANALEGRHAVTRYRLVSESDDGDRYELALAGDSVVSKIVRHGGRPQSIEATAAGMDVIIDVPMSTDVRSFVEMLGTERSVELISRREVTRSLQTQERLVDAILDHLTERQREVLRTAFFAGFFNWPRDTTGQELAEMLDVSQPTVNRHLRLGQQRVMRQLFESRTVAESE